MKRSFSSNLLIFLLFFLFISALAGGWGLISDPTGANLGFTTDMLQYAPFSNFMIPGLFLFVVLGVFPLMVQIGLVKKHGFKLAEKMNPYPNYHWSWTFAYFIGLLLIVWINMELLWIRAFHNLHFFYSMLGVLIVFVAQSPRVKKDYLLVQSHQE